MNRVYKSDEGERKVRDRYLALLKRWPVPNQQIRVATSQGETLSPAGRRAPLRCYSFTAAPETLQCGWAMCLRSRAPFESTSST